MGHTRRGRPGLAVQKSKMLRSLKPCLLPWGPLPSAVWAPPVPGVSFLHQGYCLKKALLTLQNPAGRCVDKQEFPKSSESPKNLTPSVGVRDGKDSWVLSSVQSLSRVQLFAIPWTAACQASLSFTISRSLLTLMPVESVMATPDKDFR